MISPERSTRNTAYIIARRIIGIPKLGKLDNTRTNNELNSLRTDRRNNFPKLLAASLGIGITNIIFSLIQSKTHIPPVDIGQIISLGAAGISGRLFLEAGVNYFQAEDIQLELDIRRGIRRRRR